MEKRDGARIEVDCVSKSYGNINAVEKLSFTLDGAGVYGLLGPNGAGKTTTMNIMTGCLAPGEGTVRYDGKDIINDAVEVKKRIGYLPEQPPLYQEMTVSEFVTFTASARGVARRDMENQVNHALTAAGVIDVKNRLIRTLSKGYKQRVGIAMAIVGDPDVIILDEPTVGLDPRQITQVRALIRELGEHHTVLLSSHILPEVSAVADRILIISHGKLAADGKPQELSGGTKGQKTVIAVVKGTAAQIKDALKGCAEIKGIKFGTSPRKGYMLCRVRTDGSVEDPCELVASELMKKQLTVTRLEEQEKNLEDTFLDITEGN